MLYELNVNLDNRSYPIKIGYDLLMEAGKILFKEGLKGNCLVIADNNTSIFYDELRSSLDSNNINSTLTVVDSGENSKSLAQLKKLYSHCIKAKLDRQSFIIALGGGVIGDLAGYVSATYLRGIDFIQIPTSLLAMVDSAVGGKTGVNLDEGKNLVGSFHQPKLVLSDLKTLKSLPNREFIAGMAEVIKYGIIYDKNLFSRIEESFNEIIAKNENSSLLAEIIGRCCEIKAEIVSKDEKENDLRAILNFGHTVGHAIENKSGYSSSMIHGEAISIGMVFAAEVSCTCFDLSMDDVNRIKKILTNVGLPICYKSLGWNELKEVINIDKKTVNGKAHFVLASKIGDVSIGHVVDDEILENTWNKINE
ncbi:MAG: 3-dehydroquinate synthase [Verrucomicrobiota bacterium]|nr:3-dehydroquinate synthase [Verrucomicrobiota bacterium]